MVEDKYKEPSATGLPKAQIIRVLQACSRMSFQLENIKQPVGKSCKGHTGNTSFIDNYMGICVGIMHRYIREISLSQWRMVNIIS